MVDDEAWRAVANAGIKVHGRKNDPHCIYFNDPDGHQLQLLMPNE